MLKKISYSRLFILGVFIYIFFQGALFFIGLKTSTLTLENGSYTMKKKVKALLIRNEYLVKSDINGTLSLLLDENERVHKSQELAVIYNYKVDQNVNSEIRKLKNEIEELEEEKNPLKTGILSVKKEQLNILQEKVKVNTSSFYSEMSGVVSYKYDGYENEYTFEYLENLTKEDIENAKNNYISTQKNNKSIKKGSIILRVLDNNQIYMAFTNEDNKLFNEGDSVKIEINNTQINGEIYKIYKKDDYFVTIIKITQQNVGIYDTRMGEFDIIYKKIEALRIPKEAIVKEGGKRGVYLINEETHKSSFIEIQGVSYEDDDYVYVDFRNNEIKGIKTVDLHDKIILKPNFINKRISIVN